MDDRTGIFTYISTVDKSHDGEITKGRVEREKDRMLRQAQYHIGYRVVPGKMYVIAMTPLYEQDGLYTIRLEHKMLVALSDWTDAEVGDCVVGEDDFQEAFEMLNGDVWLFEPYGIFPMVGPSASSSTRLTIYRRKH